MNMTTDAHYILDMLLFVSVVESKSFTATSEKHNISKSVVSKRIKRLERNLGVQLIHRTTRRLTLTNLGKTFYQYCARIKNDIEEAEASILAKHHDIQGVLRINSPLSFSHSYLAPIAHEFLAEHPKIKIEILPGDFYNCLMENNLDLAIRIGNLPDSSYHARRITSSAVLVCAAPKYIKCYGAPQTPAELAQHNCLLYRKSPTGDNWHFVKEGEQICIRIEGNFVSSSSESLRAAAISGLGLIMLPEYLLTDDIARGLLTPVLESYCKKKINIHAIYPPTRHLPSKVRLFIDFLVKKFNHQ